MATNPGAHPRKPIEERHDQLERGTERAPLGIPREHIILEVHASPTYDAIPLAIPADEARVGQKNKLTRRWAKRGSRPSAPKDQRTASTYIFGAISPKDGKGAALVLPKCDTYAMNLHLAEIAKNVAPGAHAVLLLDQAGWHMTDKLDLPANITIVPLPPKCPELNPTENVWQFLRDNWLSNRVFKSYDDIVDHCCDAWNKLVDQPWRIMSIGMRDWAHRF
jgi:transposase